MSIPRRDPAYTLTDLEKVAKKFSDLGLEYWTAAHMAGLSGAIMWVANTDGSLVLYTRGEYRQQILNNIEQQGPVTSFGAMVEEK